MRYKSINTLLKRTSSTSTFFHILKRVPCKLKISYRRHVPDFHIQNVAFAGMFMIYPDNAFNSSIVNGE